MGNAALDVDGSASSSTSFGSRRGRFEGSGFRAVSRGLVPDTPTTRNYTHSNHPRPLPKDTPISPDLMACHTLRQRS